MKLTIRLLLLFSLIASIAHAHSLSLLISDQGDGTLLVRGIFSTGQSAAGAMVELRSVPSGDLLYRQRLPEVSELEVAIPAVPYEVILDGGPGHQVVKPGIAPPGGYPEQPGSARSTPVEAGGCSAERILWLLSGLLWGGVVWSGIRSKRLLGSDGLRERSARDS